MLLVFFFIIIFIGILFFILNVKFSVKKLVISNINSQRKIEWDFKINIGLYIGKISGLPIEYPLLCALGIAFIDALPILRFWNSNDSLGYNFSTG